METSAQFVVETSAMRMGAVLSVISNRVLDRWGDNGGRKGLPAPRTMRVLRNDESGK